MNAPQGPAQGDGSHLPHGSVTAELVRLRARVARLERLAELPDEIRCAVLYLAEHPECDPVLAKAYASHAKWIAVRIAAMQREPGT